MSQRLGSRLGAAGFVRLQKWLEGMSAEKAERIGARLGRWAFGASKKHRAIALENLARAFPEKSVAEREQIARGVLVHFGRVMSDFMRGRKRSKEELFATTTIEGIEHLDNALAAGKGMMIVSAHFGNWERIGHAVSALGYTVHIIARDVKDPAMNALVDELRKAAGVHLISRGNAAMPTLKVLKRNEIVGILPDQNSDELFVPFFGQPCGTVTGPAVLSQRSGAPLVPVYCVRVGVGKYRFWIEPPLVAEEGYEPVEGMTRAVNASLERAIRQFPEQYLWIHNRWKSAKRRGLVQ